MNVEGRRWIGAGGDWKSGHFSREMAHPLEQKGKKIPGKARNAKIKHNQPGFLGLDTGGSQAARRWETPGEGKEVPTAVVPKVG